MGSIETVAEDLLAVQGFATAPRIGAVTTPLVINRLSEDTPPSGASVEKFSRVHPGLGLFKHCLSIGLRHDAFADAKTANVDFVAKALGNLVDEVVLVALRFNVDVGLRPDQGAHIAFDAC